MLRGGALLGLRLLRARQLPVQGLAQPVQAVAAGLPPQIIVPEDYLIDRWTPHLRSLEGSRAIIKEYLGMLAYWVRGWI